MKKLLSLIVVLCATIPQAQSYTVADLRALESATAIVKSAESAIQALAPETTPAANFIGSLAQEINTLTSYALYEQSALMPFTRILDRVAAKESWQYAPQADKEFMKLFAKEFALEFSHGVSLEVVNCIQQIILAALIPDNRVARRVASTIATSCFKPLIDTTFAYLELDENDTEQNMLEALIINALQTFYKQAAYHTAGELIMRNAAGA
jgi:hypothetical protein